MAGEVLPDDVHWSMFVPNTMSTCSDAQQAHWLRVRLRVRVRVRVRVHVLGRAAGALSTCSP